MQAEHFECEFYMSWALGKWTLREVSWALCMWVYESWAFWMCIILEQSIANLNFTRAKHCEGEFMRVKHCKCEFYESWAFKMGIFW